jgi:hypothetical protein
MGALTRKVVRDRIGQWIFDHQDLIPVTGQSKVRDANPEETQCP